MADKEKKGEVDLSFILKVLSAPQISIDKIGVQLFVDKFGKGDDELKTTNNLMDALFQSGVVGFRYGQERDKGSKRFAQEVTRAIFSKKIDDYKEELRKQNKAERKQLAKLRYYLPENIEKRYQKQVEKTNEIFKKKQEEKTNILKDLVNETDRLGNLNEESLISELYGFEKMLDYAKDNFNTKEQQQVLDADKPEDKAEKIINKKYKQIFNKQEKRLKEIREQVSNLETNIVDPTALSYGNVSSTKKKVFDIDLPEFLNSDEFTDLVPEDKIDALNKIAKFYNEGLRTKNKRRKYIRENIKRVMEYEPQSFGVDDEDGGAPFEDLASQLSNSYNQDNQYLLNGIIGEDRETLKAVLKKEFGFTEKMLEKNGDIVNLSENLPYNVGEDADIKNLIQLIGKDKVFGDTIPIFTQEDFKKYYNRQLEYLYSTDEIREIINDKNLSRQEKLNRLSKNKILKDSVSTQRDRRAELLAKIDKLRGTDLEKLREKNISKLETKKRDTISKSNEIRARENFDAIKSQQFARKNKEKRKDLAIKLANLGLKPKKASSSKQAIQSIGKSAIKNSKNKDKNKKK